MKKTNFKEKISLLTKNIERHNILMIVVSSIVSLVALFFAVYWGFDEYSFGETLDYIYLVSDIVFLLSSFALTTLLVLSRFFKRVLKSLVIIIHIYVFLLLLLGTISCIMDLLNGLSPSFYYLILTIIAGLFIVEPLFFISTIFASITAVLITSLVKGAAFFSGPAKMENIMILVTYIIVIALVAFEHFSITINDYRIEKELEHLTYYDGLTGLLNERSYINETEKVDRLVKENKLQEYAVILMDVNNIKVTNDTYGHRFGCHLIVRCARMLPEFFKESKIFHIGGDEYVVIVYGEDYQNLDKILEQFEEKLVYSLISFENVELVFSVAFGGARYQKDMKYRDVLQIADKAMYEKKAAIKAKYGLKQR